MAKAPTQISLAAALCREFEDVPSLTLARKLYGANKERFPNLEAARSAIRAVRGAHGVEKRRHVAGENKVFREPGKAGWVPSCPPSSAEPWLPVQIDGPCRVLILSDVHAPYHCREALEAAVKYGRKLKPDVVLINGDWMDFHQISRWEKDPKKRDTAYEITVGKEGLSWLRGQFPKARFIFKLGNHDERLTKYVYQKCPELFGLAGLELHHVLNFEEFGIERVNDNPILLGKLPVLHGHEFGKSGIAAPVNPARGAFLRTNHTVLVGHLHRPSSHADANMWHDETMTWSTGCLCGLQPEYARINKWGWGFAHIDVAADNQFNVHNYRLSSAFEVRTA